jgi:hypothetical protein
MIDTNFLLLFHLSLCIPFPFVLETPIFRPPITLLLSIPIIARSQIRERDRVDLSFEDWESNFASQDGLIDSCEGCSLRSRDAMLS